MPRSCKEHLRRPHQNILLVGKPPQRAILRPVEPTALRDAHLDDALAGKGSQLIFTTHETAFLDLGLLRRDEIWFADKRQPDGTTELYSLVDYKVRTDLKIDKAYLEGRFEAIPPIESELPDWVRQIMEHLKPRGGPDSQITA